MVSKIQVAPNQDAATSHIMQINLGIYVLLNKNVCFFSVLECTLNQWRVIEIGKTLVSSAGDKNG